MGIIVKINLLVVTDCFKLFFPIEFLEFNIIKENFIQYKAFKVIVASSKFSNLFHQIDNVYQKIKIMLKLQGKLVFINIQRKKSLKIR